MSNPSGSRHQALAICQSAGPGTVGAVIARILSTTVFSWTVKYEIASGDIGAFYGRPAIKAILRSAWTDSNLLELSRRETIFYQTQSGNAGRVGRLLSANARFMALQAARDRLF